MKSEKCKTAVTRYMKEWLRMVVGGDRCLVF